MIVNMVQLNVAVTDKKGGYVTSLQPKDFAMYEDGIMEKAATFSEGNETNPQSRRTCGAKRGSPRPARILRSAAYPQWRI